MLRRQDADWKTAQQTIDRFIRSGLGRLSKRLNRPRTNKKPPFTKGSQRAQGRRLCKKSAAAAAQTRTKAQRSGFRSEEEEQRSGTDAGRRRRRRIRPAQQSVVSSDDVGKPPARVSPGGRSAPPPLPALDYCRGFRAPRGATRGAAPRPRRLLKISVRDKYWYV